MLGSGAWVGTYGYEAVEMYLTVEEGVGIIFGGMAQQHQQETLD